MSNRVERVVKEMRDAAAAGEGACEARLDRWAALLEEVRDKEELQDPLQVWVATNQEDDITGVYTDGYEPEDAHCIQHFTVLSRRL